MRVNAEYLKEKAEKEERERKEEEEAIREGREIKRKKKSAPPGGKDGKKQKVNLGGNQTAMEAIEKMVQVSESGLLDLNPEKLVIPPGLITLGYDSVA